MVALGCRRGASSDEAEATAAAAAEARVFPADAELLFVYADLAGEFHTVPRATDVPEIARRVVRVIDPTATSDERVDYDRVYVVDLAEGPGPDGYPSELMARHRFEQRAIAALPPGQGSRVELPGAPAPPPAADLQPHDQIILYGTSWCGACKQARAWLEARHIPYVEKDIERDSAAAAELASKAAQAGFRPSSVPIIDVRGRLMIGFDPNRLATLIGDPT